MKEKKRNKWKDEFCDLLTELTKTNNALSIDFMQKKNFLKRNKKGTLCPHWCELILCVDSGVVHAIALLVSPKNSQ